MLYLLLPLALVAQFDRNCGSRVACPSPASPGAGMCPEAHGGAAPATADIRLGHATRSIVVVSASGIGYPPRHMRGVQARLMARRAAEVTAVRNLAAKLGLPPSARMGSFRYVSVRNLPSGAVEVTVETRANAKGTGPAPAIDPPR